MAANALSNEATDVDLAAYDALAALGWKRGDTLFYQQSYGLIVFDHFVCPRIGLTATPKIAVPADGAQVDDEDLAINDTYRVFGCEPGKANYQFGLDRGIEEGGLAPRACGE